MKPVWRIKGTFIAVGIITLKEIKTGVTNLNNHKEMPLRIAEEQLPFLSECIASFPLLSVLGLMTEL